MLFKFIGVGLLVAVAIVYYFFFAGMSSSGDTQYVYIDDDDTIDSVYTKLGEVSKSNAMTGFKTLVKVSSYADNVRTGRYAVRPGEGSPSEEWFADTSQSCRAVGAHYGPSCSRTLQASHDGQYGSL